MVGGRGLCRGVPHSTVVHHAGGATADRGRCRHRDRTCRRDRPSRGRSRYGRWGRDPGSRGTACRVRPSQAHPISGARRLHRADSCSEAGQGSLPVSRDPDRPTGRAVPRPCGRIALRGQGHRRRDGRRGQSRFLGVPRLRRGDTRRHAPQAFGDRLRDACRRRRDRCAGDDRTRRDLRRRRLSPHLGRGGSCEGDIRRPEHHGVVPTRRSSTFIPARLDRP